MPIMLLTLGIMFIAVAAIGAVGLLHGHQGAQLESSMRWYASTEAPATDRRRTSDPLAA